MSDIPPLEALAALQAREANLELLDDLMNAVTDVLDVREVFDRIFEISQRSLPHDAMSIAVPAPDGTRITLYATAGALRHLPVPWEQPLQDVSLVQRDWDFVIVDDLPANPVYAPLPAVKKLNRPLTPPIPSHTLPSASPAPRRAGPENGPKSVLNSQPSSVFALSIRVPPNRSSTTCGDESAREVGGERQHPGLDVERRIGGDARRQLNA